MPTLVVNIEKCRRFFNRYANELQGNEGLQICYDGEIKSGIKNAAYRGKIPWKGHGFGGIKIGKNGGGMQKRISGLPAVFFILGLDNYKLTCVPSHISYAAQRVGISSH